MNIKSIIRTFFHRASKTLGVIVLTMTAQTVWATPTVQFPIYTDDEGTELKPYQIKSIDDLNKLAADVNSGTGYGNKYFKLVNDLTFSYTTAWNSTDAYTSNFTSIGTTVGTTSYLFQGYFDGNNKTISGLRINSNSNFQGLFGGIYATAEVKNVTIADARITGNSYTGGVVGINGGGKVTNCHVMADVAIVASGQGYGGVVGCNNGTVSCCSSSVKISVASGKSPSYLGGLVGWNYSNSSDATLTDNFVIGAIIPSASRQTHAAIAVDSKTNGYNVLYQRNYYYNCTVAGTANATGKGITTYNSSSSTTTGDISTDDGAVYRRKYTITVAAGITATTTPVTSFSGSTYYCLDGATVTLSGRPAAPTGNVYPYIVNGADVIGETFVMPAENVNVVVSDILGPADYVTEDPVGHDGTSEAKAYQIYTPEQIILLAQRVNSGTNYANKYFKLMNDINFKPTTAWNDATSTEDNYTSIGNSSNGFGGHFNCNYHTVSGIRIHKSNEGNQGLFGYLTHNSEVKNVTLADTRITGFRYNGGIAGHSRGIVTNCHVAADVNLHAEKEYSIEIGGIVGINMGGTVSNCTSAVKMTVKSGLSRIDSFGGIVGLLEEGTLKDCSAIGVIVPAVESAGAIVGWDMNDNITTLSGNTYHSCLVGTNAFNIGVGDRDDVSGDMTGATLDDTALYLDDYMDASALIAAYADPENHTAYNGVAPNVSNLTATLSRTFPAGKKQTVCLPFAPGAILTKGKVWEFTGISDNKAVMTQRTSGLTANTPYIFEATNEVTSLTFGGVTVSTVDDPNTADATAGFTFHGTYEQKHWLAASGEVTQGTIYGFMAEDNDGQTTGQFVRARRETYLRPFSCYLEYDGDLTGTQTAAARRMTRADIETLPDVIDIVWQSAGGTTGIDSMDNGKWIMDNKAGAGWYSLDGRRLNGRPTAKGIYVRGGKKFIIK